MTRRHLMIRFATLLALTLLAPPAIASHSAFDYAFDRVVVDGQPFGPFGGAADMIDGFDDGQASPFGAFVGTAQETGGLLHLLNPGLHVFGTDVSIAYHALGWAQNGQGNVCATAVWPPTPLATNTFVLAGFGNAATQESILIGLLRTDAAVAASSGLPLGLSVLRVRFEASEFGAIGIADTDVTGDVHLRVCLDDATDMASVSISLNGGATFSSPFAPTPTFTRGMITESLMAGAILQDTTTTTTTSTSTSTTASTTSTSASTTTRTTSTSASTTSSSTTTSTTPTSTTSTVTTTSRASTSTATSTSSMSTTSVSTSSSTTSTTLVRNRPPDCTRATIFPDTLWPVRGRLVPVVIGGIADPDGDPVTVTVSRVTQDEPRGGAAPDAAGVGTGSLALRAERRGDGDGRVYHATLLATDGRGASCTTVVTACTPHDQRRGGTCGDQGELVDSVGP